MSELSARLALPFILPAQAQKHITHNEALERLDILVQLSVQSFDASTPPALRENGQVWALGPAPSGEWVGEADKIAAWINGGWLFVPPRTGWVATQGSDLRIWDGAFWVKPDLPDLQNLAGVGINTAFDATNRLAVASEAALLTHSGQGHQLKINKNTPADTASLVFQTGWSGRAEMGTAGEDDFSIKVSTDGSVWHTGLRVTPSTGKAAMPNGATIEGTEAYRRGNILGAVTQTGGIPTGAIIERGSTSTGEFVRYADGTQLCYATLTLGSATALGNGTFDNPYRTDSQVWLYPAAFMAPPVITGNGTSASSTESARRMVLSFSISTDTQTSDIQAFRIGSNTDSEDCTAYMVAVGRWF